MSIDAAWRTALPPVVSLLMFFCAEPLTALREQTAKPTEVSPSQTSRSADHIAGVAPGSRRGHTPTWAALPTGPAFSPGSRDKEAGPAMCGSTARTAPGGGGSEPVVAAAPNTVSASARCSAAYSYTGEYRVRDRTPRRWEALLWQGVLPGRVAVKIRAATASGLRCIRATRQRGDSAAARCI